MSVHYLDALGLENRASTVSMETWWASVMGWYHQRAEIWGPFFFVGCESGGCIQTAPTYFRYPWRTRGSCKSRSHTEWRSGLEAGLGEMHAGARNDCASEGGSRNGTDAYRRTRRDPRVTGAH